MSSPARGASGGRPGGVVGVSVKMEVAAPSFYPEEGLELLPDFVQLPGFGANAEGAPPEEEEEDEDEEDEDEEGSKMMLVAGKKGPPFSAPSMRPPHPPPPAPRGLPHHHHRLLLPESGPPSSGVALQQQQQPPLLLKLPPVATDLEQLLIQAGNSPSGGGGGGVGGSPTPPPPPSGPTAGGGAPFLYRPPAPSVTQEQEGFADGFVKALADLHKQNQLLGVPPPPLSPTQPHPCCPTARQPEPPAIYTTLGGYNPGSPTAGGAFYSRALEEPQTVPETPGVGVVGVPVAPPPPTLSSGESPPPPQPPPSSSSLSPLDAESQERLKAERKRLRNRIAASKCRRRKLERIARLEEKVKALKGQNAELAATASLLRAQVTQLQGRVRSHLSSGCHINAAAPAPSSSSSSQTSGVVGVQPPCREGPPEPESSTC